MAMQDDDLLSPRLGQLVQSFAEVNLFRDKQLMAEPTQFPECSSLAKNERACHPSPRSAQIIPSAGQSSRPANRLIQFNRHAAANILATFNLRSHFGKQLGTGKGIRVYKNKPLSLRLGRASVTRPGDLIDGFEDDAGALCPGELGSAISRVIIADDHLMFPADLRKCDRRTLDTLQ